MGRRTMLHPWLAMTMHPPIGVRVVVQKIACRRAWSALWNVWAVGGALAIVIALRSTGWRRQLGALVCAQMVLGGRRRFCRGRECVVNGPSCWLLRAICCSGLWVAVRVVRSGRRRTSVVPSRARSSLVGSPCLATTKTIMKRC